MPAQKPYAIRGIVTYAGSVYRGALVWAVDVSQDGGPGAYTEGKNYVHTDNQGRYILSVNNVLKSGSSYSDNDTVRVFVRAGRVLTWSDVTINTARGTSTENFTISVKSGLKDGLKDTLDPNGRGGLAKSSELRGLKPGLKDALT